MLDHYWLEAAEFVRARLGRSHAVVGPREFMSALPDITPYESCTLQLLESRCHFIIHKGMADQIYQPFLYTAMLAGALVFSNDVFLVLDISGAESADHMRHAKSFVETLAQARAGTTPATGTVRSSSCYLGNSRAICTTVHGRKMIVDTNDLSLAPHLLTDGYWESWITAFIRRTIQPGWRVVDVGANFGYYTLIMADAVGPQGSVTAFEANPHLAEILSTNIEINGFRDRAKAIARAVADGPSREVQLQSYSRHFGDSSILRRDVEHDDEVFPVTIESVSLDEFFAGQDDLVLIKIDAEGSEPLILNGARRFLMANGSIRLVMEFSPPLLKNLMDPRGFLESLQDLGFQVYRIDEDSQARPKDFVDLLSHRHSELYLERSM